MTTDRQLAANRRNSRSSTGPRTKEGKHRSRRNALRHGLTAETVIDVLEDPAQYKALASRINSDYRPQSNFEHELVARLISLLWRLRRSVAIENGLFAIREGVARNRNKDRLGTFYSLVPSLVPRAKDGVSQSAASNGVNSTGCSSARAIADCFAHVSCDSHAFEKLGRYEVRLWRQTVQTILLLNSISRKAYDGCDHLHLSKLALTRRRVMWPPFTTDN
jgi:hypothetical protein